MPSLLSPRPPSSMRTPHLLGSQSRHPCLLMTSIPRVTLESLPTTFALLFHYPVPRATCSCLSFESVILALHLGQKWADLSLHTGRGGHVSRLCQLHSPYSVDGEGGRQGTSLPILTGPLWALCHGCCISSAVTSIPSLPAVKLFMSLHSFSKYSLSAAMQPQAPR